VASIQKALLLILVSTFAILSRSDKSQAADARRFLFTSDRDAGFGIYVMDADGKNLLQVANDSANLTLGGNLAPLGPSWSPDGKQLAYLSKHDGDWAVYVVNADGTNPHRASAKNLFIYLPGKPIWSRQGRIAFIATTQGKGGLYSINPDGSDPIFLDLGQFPYLYEWSPDGKQLAYQGANDYAIYIANADGTGQQQIVANINYRMTGWFPNGKSLLVFNTNTGFYESIDIDTRATTDFPILLGEVRFSPDGKSFAYWGGDVVTDGVITSGGIYVGSMKSKRIVQGAKVLDDATVSGYDWSPDSKRIAFSSARSRTMKIYSMSVDGTDLRSVGSIPGQQPELSPNGKQIVFVSSGQENSNIFVMDVDGINQQQLTKDRAVFNKQPIWTNDGKHIIYYSAGKTLTLNIMDANGKNQKRLVTFRTNSANPKAVLSPDGQNIAYGVRRQSGSSDVYITGFDGKPPRLLANTGKDPKWSPDGKHIVFIGHTEPGSSLIPQIIDPDGKNQREFGTGLTKILAWSPDSTQIAYMSINGVYVIGITSPTNQPRKVWATRFPATSVYTLDFQESMNDLVWLSENELLVSATVEGNSEIYRIKTDGSAPINLTQNPSEDKWISLANMQAP
jgi:Tol biopolymer transport system component